MVNHVSCNQTIEVSGSSIQVGLGSMLIIKTAFSVKHVTAPGTSWTYRNFSRGGLPWSHAVYFRWLVPVVCEWIDP